MARRQLSLDPTLLLDELEAYHQDVVSSLQLYFSPTAPTFTARFAGEPQDQVVSTLKSRLDETDVRSTLAVLTSLEARFRVDFDIRCTRRLKDPLLFYFRKIWKVCGVGKGRGNRVRLDEDILEGWKMHTTASTLIIGELRGAFRFRHWLAHGRYWNVERKYDFEYVHLMANTLVSGFQFTV